jgi:hypothetical protein
MDGGGHFHRKKIEQNLRLAYRAAQKNGFRDARYCAKATLAEKLM